MNLLTARERYHGTNSRNQEGLMESPCLRPRNAKKNLLYENAEDPSDGCDSRDWSSVVNKKDLLFLYR